MEEDSFEVRVKRLFGSQLFESVPRSSFPSSSWSVFDGEVERREWNRERGFGPDRSEDPCSSAFSEGGCFAKKRRVRTGGEEDFDLDIDDLDNDPDAEVRREEDEEESRDGDSHGEESEIRSSIGLDPTLDNEDEEDEFDRAAEGRDASTERLYMGDIKKHGPHLNYYSIFEEVEDEPYIGSHNFHKDPRADHLAAGMRIEEDQKIAVISPILNHSKPVIASQDFKLKPILKRKVVLDDLKPKKRVRFDHVSESDYDPNSASLSSESPDLPDYLRNPSRYTHYSFNDYEDSKSANEEAFQDLHDILHKNSNPDQLEQPMDDELSKSITFNPRRRSIDVLTTYDSSELVVARSTGIAAGQSFKVDYSKDDDEEDEEETAMDTETGSDKEKASRSARQYRSMAASDL